jgi:hypothetical protein
MYLMVVVVAGVDAVENVSFAPSQTIGGARTAVQNRKSHGEDLGTDYLMIPLVP